MCFYLWTKPLLAFLGTLLHLGKLLAIVISLLLPGLLRGGLLPFGLLRGGLLPFGLLRGDLLPFGLLSRFLVSLLRKKNGITTVFFVSNMCFNIPSFPCRPRLR